MAKAAAYAFQKVWAPIAPELREVNQRGLLRGVEKKPHEEKPKCKIKCETERVENRPQSAHSVEHCLSSETERAAA